MLCSAFVRRDHILHVLTATLWPGAEATRSWRSRSYVSESFSGDFALALPALSRCGVAIGDLSLVADLVGEASGLLGGTGGGASTPSFLSASDDSDEEGYVTTGRSGLVVVGVEAAAL